MAPDQVDCPSCSKPVAFTRLNSHLDRCLSGQVDGGSSSSGGGGATSAENSNGGLFGAMMGSRKRKAEEVETEEKLQTESKRRPSGVIEGQSQHSTAQTGASTATTSIRDRIDEAAPLAERLRPRTLEEYVGQEDIVKGPVAALLRQGKIPSIILWGPPGTGKTTLARLLAKTANENIVAARRASQQAHLQSHSHAQSQSQPAYRFVEVSATTANTSDVKKIFDESLSRLQLTGQRTVLFIDEVQRFSRAQQDVFLPVIEKGQIVLIAATTENPSFRLQSALLSRMRVFVLTKLSVEHCEEILQRARDKAVQLGYACGVKEDRQHGNSSSSPISDAIIHYIAQACDGDARSALQALEIALATVDPRATDETNLTSLKTALKRQALHYDRTGDMHYDTISALHKSIRGSNPNAALYWLARMVSSGDDPLFIARRLIVAASEDCDTLQAIQMATCTYQACQVVGLPECGENLAQCVVFLAESKKSTRSYKAWKKALALVEHQQAYPVPFHIRNAPTKLMKDLGYAKEYRYEPRFAHPVHQEYFPPEIRQHRFLSPPPDDDDDNTLLPTTSLLPPHAGSGPGSCQRIFNVGARVVDFDLLDEWEQVRNGGQRWSGRDRLERIAPRDEGRS